MPSAILTQVVRTVKMMACLTSELDPGSMRNVDILGRTIMVVNVGGAFYAIDGICSHGLADLTQGRLDDFMVECLRTGRGTMSAPARCSASRWTPRAGRSTCARTPSW